MTFSYPAAGVEMVELRGNFAPDGWEVGVPLSRQDDRFEVTLTLPDGARIEYKFVVDGEWVTDPGNPNTVDDTVGGVNSLLVVDCDDCDDGGGVTRGYDWRDGIMYFVMVDRFLDGDPTNNAALDGVDWRANFQGGDLAGVLEKIEEGYFDDLGVNVLWLTAPFDNADGSGLGIGDDDNVYSAYHGYWPADLDAVDDKIGTLEELKAVIDAAHARGIRVILDYVMNHVHAESPVYAEHPDWFWPLGDCLCGQGCSWDGAEGRRCWFTDYLPDFNFQVAAARDYSVGNAIGWAKDLGIDGYRLDAVKHIEKSWVTQLRARLSAEVEGEDRFYLVGETFTGDRGLIREYVGPDQLDGQFDFPLRAQLIDSVLQKSQPMSALASFLDDNESYYGDGAIMGTFVGNHDVPRSIHLAEDTPRFGTWEGGKEIGWTDPPPLPAGASAFERLALAFTVLFTTPGVPLIYYGDEIGLPGAGDPDNRRAMQWGGYTSDQQWLRQRIADLAAIRAAHPALRRGTRTNLAAGDDVFVFEMSAGADRVLVALNRADGERAATGVPAGSYTELLAGEAIEAPTMVPARGALILVRR